MKKYVFFIVSIGVILAGLLFYNVYNVQKENMKNFEEPGYILQSASGQTQKIDKYYFNANEEYKVKNNQKVIFKDTSGDEVTTTKDNFIHYNNGATQKIDKYYFNANEEYKVKNNQKVIFKDTSGDEVTTTKDNFIHYNNGAISSLKKGVLINLANIDQDPITYYSIAANQIVKKQSENYYINHLNNKLQFKNLIWKISDTKYLIAGSAMTVTFDDGTTKEINGNKLQFKNLIWKISDTKYLIAGSAMTVTFDDGTTKEINGYIELEYLDNQIIKLYNQEIIYQTISSKVNIKMPENIEINLQSKAVNKNIELEYLDNQIIKLYNQEIIYQTISSKVNIKMPENIEINLQSKAVNKNGETKMNLAQIIKLYNQEIIYQTISSKVNIKMPENIEINLQSKAVNKNGETKMNLANMVIDSDDNVEIVEETKEDKYKENKIEESLQNEIDTENVDNEETGNNQNQNNQNGNGNGTNNQNGQDSQTGTNVEGNVQDGNVGEGQNGGSGGIIEEEVEDLPELVAPVFKVESFDVDSISLNAQVTIQDDEARLVRNPYIKILDNATGKNVYAKEEALGTYNIDIAVSTLSPETDYTLVIESA